MSLKEKLEVLAPDMGCFIQAIFVFTAARVTAKWGNTKNVHCMRDTQLSDYIAQKKGNRLSPAQIEILTRAFMALAAMEFDFEEQKYLLNATKEVALA